MIYFFRSIGPMAQNQQKRRKLNQSGILILLINLQISEMALFKARHEKTVPKIFVVVIPKEELVGHQGPRQSFFWYDIAYRI